MSKENQADSELGNRFVRVIGLAGFIVATVGFLLVLSGVPVTESAENSAGVVLFNSFIMCAALAFAGILITTMAQVSDTLKNIESLLEEQNKMTKPKKKAPAKKKKAATKKKS